MTAEQEIRSLLSTYEGALNASDAELAASLYTADGVFMPLPVHGFLGHLIGAGCPCGGGIHDRLSGGNERA